MRKNPYNKKIKGHLPLFMRGPSVITALTENEGQKVILEHTMKIKTEEFHFRHESFTMVFPPILNLNFTVNPEDVLNVGMGQTEVTQELFGAIMGWNYSRFQSSSTNPVEMVTWYDCIYFCNRLSELSGLRPYYEMKNIELSQNMDTRHSIEGAGVMRNEDSNGFRLPTSKEWRAFAKAGTQNAWAGTNVESELGKYALYKKTSKYETCPVGNFLPNEWGLYDMSGNVEEWCWDEDEEDQGFAMRVVRGGAFNDDAEECWVDLWGVDDAFYRSKSRGFRVCKNLY